MVVKNVQILHTKERYLNQRLNNQLIFSETVTILIEYIVDSYKYCKSRSLDTLIQLDPNIVYLCPKHRNGHTIFGSGGEQSSRIYVVLKKVCLIIFAVMPIDTPQIVHEMVAKNVQIFHTKETYLNQQHSHS